MTQLQLRRRETGAHPTRQPHSSLLWRLKLRLQFTGWLQYLITAAAAVVFLLVAGIGRLIDIWLGDAWLIALCWVPLGIGAVLLAAAAFDVVTVKLGVRPFERKPRRLDDLDVFDLIRARRSTRAFQHRDLTAADRTELLRTLGDQVRPDRLIGTSPIRLEYIAAPLTVWPTVGAHEFIVAIAPRDYDRMAIIDVGRSLQKVVLHATRIGVATCWIGPGADQSSIVSHLGDRFDPARDHVVCVCAIGYRSRFEPLSVRVIELVQHRRLPLSQLFFADPGFHRPLPVDTPPFSAFGRTYEASQWSPSSFNSQTTRGAGITDETGRSVARFDFAAATGSRYYAPVALGIWCANWETGTDALGRPGHFEALTPQQRGLSEPTELPHYDVSWIPTPAH